MSFCSQGARKEAIRLSDKEQGLFWWGDLYSISKDKDKDKEAKAQNKTGIIFFLDYLPLKKEGPSKHFFEVTISLLGIPCKQCGNIFGIFDNLLFLINLHFSVVGTFDIDNNFQWNVVLFINESLQKKRMYMFQFSDDCQSDTITY